MSSSSNISVLAYLGVIAITNEFVEFKPPTVKVCNIMPVALEKRADLHYAHIRILSGI